MKPFKALNAGKSYTKRIKPFNFILSCHVRNLGHPIGADLEHFHLIAPYETDPRKWETMRSLDQYSKDGKRYRISASAAHGSPTMARVKSYRDVLREYEYHPEAKCADAHGAPCEKQSRGLLGRRHVVCQSIVYIGKESNNVEAVEEQTLTDPTTAYTIYPRDEWESKWLPLLRSTHVPQILGKRVSRAAIYAARAGREPYGRTKSKLIALLRDAQKTTSRVGEGSQTIRLTDSLPNPPFESINA